MRYHPLAAGLAFVFVMVATALPDLAEGRHRARTRAARTPVESFPCPEGDLADCFQAYFERGHPVDQRDQDDWIFSAPMIDWSEVDLDRNPRTSEAIVRVVGLYWCGATGNCANFVLQRHGKRVRVLLEANGRPLTVLEAWRGEGYAPLLSAYHGGGPAFGWQVYSWAGDRYESAGHESNEAAEPVLLATPDLVRDWRLANADSEAETTMLHGCPWPVAETGPVARRHVGSKSKEGPRTLMLVRTTPCAPDDSFVDYPISNASGPGNWEAVASHDGRSWRLEGHLGQFVSRLRAWFVDGMNRLQPRPKTHADRLIDAARALLDVPYAWGGRSRDKLDCLGLLFLAWGKATGRDWHGLSVMPTKLAKQIGASGDYVSAEHFATPGSNGSPARGSVIFFLAPAPTEDAPQLEVDGTKLWVWHVGLATGFGRVIHASPWKGRVVEEDLGRLLAPGGEFTGFVVVEVAAGDGLHAASRDAAGPCTYGYGTVVCTLLPLQ